MLIGWIGLPDNHYPTEEEDWEGSMSLPRELRIRNGKLIQTPVAEIDSLLGEEVPADGNLPAACEVRVKPADAGQDFDLALFTKADGSGGLRMHYDAEKKLCTFDKSGMTKRFNPQVGEVLTMPLAEGLFSIRIFIDRSSVEYFFNEGEASFTSHSYPTEEEFHYTATPGAEIRIRKMNPSVEDTFIV